MNITQLAEKTGVPKQVLLSAAEALKIPEDNLTRDDIVRIHTFLKNRSQLNVSAAGLRALADVDPSTASVDRKRVAFLGGEGFAASFIATRKNEGIEKKRKTRNCGDTAGLVLEGLKLFTQAMTVQRDWKREDFCAYLHQKATAHVVSQVTIHQHTFTLERHSLGNWIVQSYQCSAGTYNVQFWCGLEDPYIDLSITQSCGPLSEKWYNPSDLDLADLATLIERLYDEGKEKRGAIWRQLPFNPADTGRVLEESQVLGFAAERILLSGARYLPCTVAGLEELIFNR